VSSYAPLTIDGVEVATFRNGVDLSVGLLFSKDELSSHKAVGDEMDRWEYTEVDGTPTIHEFVATASAIRDRLDVLGIGLTAVQESFDQLLSDRRQALQFRRSFLGDWSAAVEFQAEVDEETRVLDGLTLERWNRLIGERYHSRYVAGAARPYVSSLRWLIGLWEESDTRMLIRALLEALPEASEVRIDVTDIIDGGYMTVDSSPREAALDWMGDEVSRGTPVVILTEGPSDSRILQGSLEIVKPHLKEYLRFPDFSYAPESNAPALVKTVKSFAAAGISNRVVAVFDNDTAAEDALRALASERLPRNISIFRLPYLGLASNYPTIGPTGTVVMDVNGLAGSIELYLGHDVLRDSAGALHPVQWRGYNDALRRYQGEVTSKRHIQESFQRKVEAARRQEVLPVVQDWSGISLIFDELIQLLAR
jgi:hypothetical protein